MNRRLLALSLTAVALLNVAGRKPNDPKHENHYKSVQQPTVDGLELTLNGAESQVEFIKLNAKLTNRTSDRIFVLRKDQGEFVLPSGTEKAKAPTLFGGPLVIPPGESGTYTWAADGNKNISYHVDSFSFHMGGLTSAPNKGAVATAPDFQLPPSVNTFTAGPFECNLTDHSQTTDDTFAFFECSYSGTGVGFIDQRRIGARSQSGKEYANTMKNASRDVILPGNKAKFKTHFEIPITDGDMQFVPFNVIFRDTFSEAPGSEVKVEPWTFEVDAALTAEQN
ncbi:MAG TPA: hypothetical protein PKY30_01920 [Myxococcota bacterium]|nr:hypothetical protein [Myxococcota bacterium]HNH45760.1 hypothetical protein [Myxococcota bacterium]